jgi:hypothetical protein
MPSIYWLRSNIAADVDVRHGEQVNTDAQQPQQVTDDQSQWLGRRNARPANYLLAATLRWLESLPIENRPNALAEQYPRILNLIVANWNSPRDCNACLYSLLHDQRGRRRGFPNKVARDIVNLRVYYSKLHPIELWEFQRARKHNQYSKP